jgi:hypothetical protein
MMAKHRIELAQVPGFYMCRHADGCLGWTNERAKSLEFHSDMTALAFAVAHATCDVTVSRDF